jgi:hypothetical protein
MACSDIPLPEIFSRASALLQWSGVGATSESHHLRKRRWSHIRVVPAKAALSNRANALVSWGLPPYLMHALFSGTGFSREEAGPNARCPELFTL